MNTLGYEVGDTIFAFNYMGGVYLLMEGKVERITPKGRIAAVFKGDVRKAFMPSGKEVGGSNWFHWRIRDKDQQEEDAQFYRAEQAKHSRWVSWRKETDVLRNIPFDVSEKENLLKQLDVLQEIITKLE